MGLGAAIGVAGILLFGFGIAIGYAIGDRLSIECVTERQYWLANGAVVVLGVLLAAVVQFTEFMLLYAAVVGLMGGAIAGLKFGFGESVGPWKAHDEAFRVNKGHLETAESGKGEERRRRRKEGGPEPELMSVSNDGNRGKK
ncbi:MAG: hypothetical protein IJH87_06200 [Atopobiaceae bacterium]|nr:hypothetical protein [Atopobiaceae bacterium]